VSSGVPTEQQVTTPPPPATRSLDVVLREALASGDEVRMLVAKGLPDGSLANPNAYMNVEIEGLQIAVPKVAGAGLGGSATGYAVYVLATRDFLLAVGTVSAAAGGAVGGLIPIGTLLMWPTAAAPAGFLLCNGSSFSGATYPALAALLGTTTLPDLRRRLPVGAGTGFGVGGSDGLAEGSRSLAHHHRLNAGTDSQGSHQHGNAGGHQHNSLGGGFFAETGLGLTGAAGTARYVVSNGFSQTDSQGDHTHPAAGGHTHTVNADTSGGGPQDTPSYYVVNFIIRAL
jgi:microcystin-dependent protein